MMPFFSEFCKASQFVNQPFSLLHPRKAADFPLASPPHASLLPVLKFSLSVKSAKIGHNENCWQNDWCFLRKQIISILLLNQERSWGFPVQIIAFSERIRLFVSRCAFFVST